MSSASDLLHLDVPCDRFAPATVRAALAQIHEDECRQDEWSLDDGLLVASELVTNAVMHSGCAPGHTLQVSAGLRGDRLLISVHDPGFSGQRARPHRTESSEAGGWGLRIVGQLAQRWGSERPDGYRVWAELAAST